MLPYLYPTFTLSHASNQSPFHPFHPSPPPPPHPSLLLLLSPISLPAVIILPSQSPSPLMLHPSIYSYQGILSLHQFPPILYALRFLLNSNSISSLS